MEHTSRWRGVVKGIGEDWNDKTKVTIDIELPAAKGSGKKAPKGCGPCVEARPRRSVTVGPEMAATLAVGDTVEVETTVRPFGKKSSASGVQSG